MIEAVDLEQGRPGAEPRWRWQPSQRVDHATTERAASTRLLDYDAVLASRDVVGSLNLVDALADAVEIFGDLLDQQERPAPNP